MNYILAILIFVLGWILFGFVAFFMEAFRSRCYTKFDEDTKEDFIFIVACGIFSFIVEMYLFLKKWVIQCMNKLLDIINKF